MIRIQNIPLPLDGDLEQLRKKAARILGVRPGALEELTLVRQSIDARKKQDVHYVYTVDVSLRTGEEQAVERTGKKNVSLVLPKPYLFPEVKRRSPSMPVVVGMGPAGLFAALFLARNGLPCVVLERGQDVDRRTAQVERFWDSGLLDPSSNVQFGEGGAGTFSDGKLTTGTHDPRISAVIDTLVESGAPEDVKWSHKPHIGTDILRQVVKRIRQELISLGCDVRFGHCLSGLETGSGALSGVWVACEAGGTAWTVTPWCWPRDTQPGTPSPCSTRRVCLWSRRISPWACASSRSRQPSPGPSTAQPGSSCPLRTISWPATCPPAGPPSPSASAPAARWWPPPPHRARW